VTPEATAQVVERLTPGLDEAMREVSRRASPHGLLSRGASGIAGHTLVVNFPGSPRACEECFDAISGALRHGVELLLDRPTEHP
jgi:molybdopterin biosynthesis enzyme MoaB